MRVACLGLVSIVIAGTGCLRITTTWDIAKGVPIATPKIDEASLEAADRVEVIARQLLDATPLGIPDIDVVTIGSRDPEVFHRDPHVLYITDGYAKLCKTDEDLAAVLAREFGTMTMEYRRQQVRVSSHGGAGPIDGDAASVSLAMLRALGYGEDCLARTEPLAKQASMHSALAKQLSGASAKPVWSK